MRKLLPQRNKRTLNETTPPARERATLGAIITVIVLAMIVRSAVYGFAVDITHAHGAAEVFTVTTRSHGRFFAADVQHCGLPKTGTAYIQYVALDSGANYRTLYSGTCAYEVWR